MMLVNIQVKIHSDDAREIRRLLETNPERAKRLKVSAVKISVDHEHFAVVETVDEGEEYD